MLFALLHGILPLVSNKQVFLYRLLELFFCLTLLFLKLQHSATLVSLNFKFCNFKFSEARMLCLPYFLLLCGPRWASSQNARWSKGLPCCFPSLSNAYCKMSENDCFIYFLAEHVKWKNLDCVILLWPEKRSYMFQLILIVLKNNFMMILLVINKL